MAGVLIRELKKPEEFEEAVEVQASAWRMTDYREAVPAHLLRALADNGGLVLGAFDEKSGKLVGVCFGFFVCTPGNAGYFYSHQTGVVEERKYAGVGYRLKLAQREKVLERGVKLITWTFDPLQSLNAKFNFSKLGVLSRRFLANYYGELRDGINVGMPTDRFKVEWWLTSRRVVGRVNGTVRPPSLEAVLETASPASATEVGRSAGVPVLRGVRRELSSRYILVAVPKDIGAVRGASGEEALRWRLGLRELFARYLGELGYVVVEYVIEEGDDVGYYVLAKEPLDRVLNNELPWYGGGRP